MAARVPERAVINELDIEITAWPRHPHGGQQAGTSIGVAAFHPGTGLGVIVHDERSLTKNRRRAIDLLCKLIEETTR
jgi:protein subunit release factor A